MQVCKLVLSTNLKHSHSIFSNFIEYRTTISNILQRTYSSSTIQSHMKQSLISGIKHFLPWNTPSFVKLGGAAHPRNPLPVTFYCNYPRDINFSQQAALSFRVCRLNGQVSLLRRRYCKVVTVAWWSVSFGAVGATIKITREVKWP